ncbi:MAG: hypothetical protein FJ011_24660 [Chloroflexi bacterium]|nr:hypothetical protein [Chloroflexota bacterium]
MRKVFLFGAVILMLSLVVGLYPSWAEKPARDGVGPMAIRIAPRFPAPEYHSPLDWWQTHHMDIVNRGDVTQRDCLYCHAPETSCNNCHRYVGVAVVGGLVDW